MAQPFCFGMWVLFVNNFFYVNTILMRWTCSRLICFDCICFWISGFLCVLGSFLIKGYDLWYQYDCVVYRAVC